MIRKKYIYAICTLLLVGCMASRKSPENKTIGKEKVTIRHMYTADPSAHVWADDR